MPNIATKPHGMLNNASKTQEKAKKALKKEKI